MDVKHIDRVWMLSDIHFGLKNASVEWLDITKSYFYDFFIPLVKQHKKDNDALFILGDLFDNRQVLGLLVQDTVIKLFEDLSKEFKDIYIIVGNHDLWHKNSNDITSVSTLKYIPNVKIFQEPEVLEFKKYRALMMPWQKNASTEIEVLSNYPGIDYVFCHSEISGVKGNAKSIIINEHGNDISNFKRFKGVYSGHIHYGGKYGNLTILGNPYEMSRSDIGNTKGVYILDVNTGEEFFHENRVTPRFIKLNISDILDLTVGELKAIVKNNFVDLYVLSDTIMRYNFGSLVSLIEPDTKKLTPQVYEDSKSLESILSDTPAEYTAFDLLSVIKEYIEGLEIDKNLKPKVLKKLLATYKQISNK